jgi:formylglycine-generating enzyme required for sulfatase activity
MTGRTPFLLAACLLLASALAIFPEPPAGRAAPTVEHAAYKETIPGSNVSFDMVPIPAGTFTMGSPDAEVGHEKDEAPQVKVQLAAFWMEKCETTWDMYDLYWKDENLQKPTKQDPIPHPGYPDILTRPTEPYSDETFGHAREGHPVLAITHHAAMEFCRWLSKKTGKIYRLPTEAEWEYACRAGTKTAYYFGDDLKDLGDHAWFATNSMETVHKIGTKKPNPWGLYDMYGNVAEWCLDHYKPDDYAKYPAGQLVFRPVRKPTEFRYSHVLRGGGWPDEAARCRSAARRGSDHSFLKRDPQRPQGIWWMTDADFVGFRIVRPVEEQPDLKDLKPLVTFNSKNYDEK